MDALAEGGGEAEESDPDVTALLDARLGRCSIAGAGLREVVTSCQARRCWAAEVCQEGWAPQEEWRLSICVGCGVAVHALCAYKDMRDRLGVAGERLLPATTRGAACGECGALYFRATDGEGVDAGDGGVMVMGVWFPSGAAVPRAQRGAYFRVRHWLVEYEAGRRRAYDDAPSAPVDGVSTYLRGHLEAVRRDRLVLMADAVASEGAVAPVGMSGRWAAERDRLHRVEGWLVREGTEWEHTAPRGRGEGGKRRGDVGTRRGL